MKTETIKGPGRPPLPEGEGTTWISMRLPTKTLTKLKKRAAISKLSTGKFVAQLVETS